MGYLWDGGESKHGGKRRGRERSLIYAPHSHLPFIFQCCQKYSSLLSDSLHLNPASNKQNFIIHACTQCSCYYQLCEFVAVSLHFFFWQSTSYYLQSDSHAIFFSISENVGLHKNKAKKKWKSDTLLSSSWAELTPTASHQLKTKEQVFIVLLTQKRCRKKTLSLPLL